MFNLQRREILAAGIVSMAAPALAVTGTPPSRRSSFTPGQPWLDTSGKPIFVHGGSVITVDDTFYWYGENKERTTGRDRIWHWGVRAYRSHDLYNWDDIGTIVPPQPDDPASPLHPFKAMDRPHIVYNRETKKFVCWIKVMEDPWQTRAVLVADQFTGPYTLIRQHERPLGMSAGDFDIVTSPDDGKGYMYFERVHSETICADLTDDYTDFSGYYSTHFPRPGPPLVREGLSYFRRHNRHYLASSGTTGYFPNPSEIAQADSFHGPWTVLGDLHPGDRSRTSFNSQISSVFRHPGKRDLYIALADRWMGPLSGPEFDSGDLSRRVQSAFAKVFARSGERLTPDEGRAMAIAGTLKVNTSQSGQVWLPIRFEGERPFIDWRAEWSLGEFE